MLKSGDLGGYRMSQKRKITLPKNICVVREHTVVNPPMLHSYWTVIKFQRKLCIARRSTTPNRYISIVRIMQIWLFPHFPQHLVFGNIIALVFTYFTGCFWVRTKKQVQSRQPTDSFARPQRRSSPWLGAGLSQLWSSTPRTCTHLRFSFFIQGVG